VSDVEAINRSEKIALLSTDETIPIPDWYEMGGYNCDPSEAVTCVAGPCSNGKWYSIDLRQYEGIILQ
jgi:hypothetical protein